MIKNRPFWQDFVERAWKEKNVIWLMGVRRVGKTSLCMSLPDIEYFDCESPSVRRVLKQDPEAFLSSKTGKRVVLDEIHLLENPSELLKLAADHYPGIRILATGSSTIGASSKFKDTLTGRKREIWLTPLLLEEMEIFGNADLRHRLLFGGFPSYFVQQQFPERAFIEWIDAYWAKDIADLFSVGRRYSFQKFVELLLAQSGGQFEASKFAGDCEVSRPTISNYLGILQETFVVHVVRPFSTRKATEIVKAPKVYGLDTGFVCFAKGWRELRQEDLGLLWEHIILNELQAHLQIRYFYYWRDKSGHEIDFVLPKRGGKSVTIIECKFKSIQFGQSTLHLIGRNVEAFRRDYRQGENFVVASDVRHSYRAEYNGTILTFISPGELIIKLSETE